ncbi:MAG TPA: hypothetical protein VLV54_18630 [Thermoanaerobaculia bacterium]|nr:hypothetical protein [Thermoanaerobaculia bacterium]
MRRLTLSLLGLALLSTAAAALAEEPVAADLSTPAAAEAPLVTSPAPLSLLPENPQPAFTLPCPPEPVVTCNTCFLLGTYYSYQCTTFCVNGVFHRSCSYCGSGCPL